MLDYKVWRVWLRTYGASDAIALAEFHGYSREEIVAANDELQRCLLEYYRGVVREPR